MTETASGAEYISEAHVRHILRYVQARDWLIDKQVLTLDAACGTGYGTKLLARAGFQMMGVDFNDDALIEMARHKPMGCHFMKADLLEANFSVGAIVSIETLEHFSAPDGKKLLNKFYRWLSSGGPLIISTPYCEASGPSSITKQHLWEYSLTDFEQALVQAGFSVELIKTERHEGQAGRLGYAMAKAIKR